MDSNAVAKKQLHATIRRVIKKNYTQWGGTNHLSNALSEMERQGQIVKFRLFNQGWSMHLEYFIPPNIGGGTVSFCYCKYRESTILTRYVGVTPTPSVETDHIRPRRRATENAVSFDNLVLCEAA